MSNLNKLCGILVGMLGVIVSAYAVEEVVVLEGFDGTGDALHGTQVDIFNSGIVDAGGSATWVAAPEFKNDGSVDPAPFRSAYLPLGMYINNAKGSSKGRFVLSAELTKSSAGNWGSIGFFNNPDINADFTRNSMGLATLIYRTSGELDGFGGPGTGSTNVDGPDGQPSPQLLTVVLDFTPAGGYDGLSNFGSAHFYQGTESSENLMGSWTYTADYSFDAIGLSQASYNGRYTNLSLSLGEAVFVPPFALQMKPSDTQAKSYDFEWASTLGTYYKLISSETMSGSTTAWAVWDPDGVGGNDPYEMIGPASEGTYTLSEVPMDDAEQRFFVIAETDPPEPEPTHFIQATNYDIDIENPGFRMEVSTSAGIVLPADSSSGLYFLDSMAVSSVSLGKSGDVYSYRVTNANGQTARVDIEAKARVIEVDVTLDGLREGAIRMRTASPDGPAFGLGDIGGWEANADLSLSQKTFYLNHNGHRHRWLSSFLVFPASGVAGACFERQGGSVSIGPSYYRMANSSASSQKFYYFIGSMEEIYAAWRTARIANGFPGVAPKMDGFELGFETWDLLKWNTNARTCQNAIRGFLNNGYKIRWAVTGSGFWFDDGTTSGTTTSFGLYENTKYPETSSPAPPDFGDWCKARNIRWMIGLRTNFIPEDGPHRAARASQNGATQFDTSVGTEEGLTNNYFLKNSSGATIKRTSTIFPTVGCYLLDGNVPGAGTWFKSQYDAWGVDGVKEDTMMSAPDHTIYNGPMRAIAEGGDLVMARCGAYSSPGTLTRINDTRVSEMTRRIPVNYLQNAASGAPHAYSDSIGFGSIGNVTSTVRHAWLQALTAGMAVSSTPWNWSSANQATLKKAVDFHYEIGPYLHSCAVDSHNTGYPHTMTPIAIAYPDDPGTYTLANNNVGQYQWMIGPSLLATPRLRNYASSTANVYLPPGKWIDIETGTVYAGPTTLTGFSIPLEKVPVFVGGKGVYISRIDEVSPLQAVVFPIATGGSSYTFTHPDGIATSTVVNNNVGWNTETLAVTNTETSQPVVYVVDATTGAIRFDILPGNNYALSGGD